MLEKPLKGRKVIITRSKEDLVGVRLKLRKLGAITIEVPSLRFVRSGASEMDALSKLDLGSFDWIVFTSVNGVRFFLERLKQQISFAISSSGVRIAATGPATSELLRKNGIRVDFIPDEFVTEEIARNLPGVDGNQILLPRSNIADKRLASDLKKRGAKVLEIAVYRTLMPQSPLPSLSNMVKGDLVLFASASSVHNFVKIVGRRRHKNLCRVLSAACIGPVTAEVAESHGFRVNVVAKTHTIDGLLADLVLSLSAA